MKYNSKKVYTFIITLLLVILITGSTFAHSGRTDSNGGHKDNQNKSGLGSYHYHCGGHPAHLHENGVCPYASSSSSSSNKTSTSTSSTKSPSSNKSSSSTSSSSRSTSSTSTTNSSNSTSVTTSSSSVTTKEETIVKAESIEINENITKMKVGETQKLTASITPTNTTVKDIIWKSSNEDIATISTTGKIVALEVGTVRITASTNNGKTDVIEIIIEEEVKEENNTIAMPIINVESSNTITNKTTDTTENSDNSGFAGLLVLGGGSYLGYKIYRKFKK